MTAMFPDWAGTCSAPTSRGRWPTTTPAARRPGVTDAQIDDWFAIRGINVIWTLDGLKAGTYGTGGQRHPQPVLRRGITAAEPQWPGQSSDGGVPLGVAAYVEGTFQFLDGGRLDLGVVRDSMLDATNDYEMFVETFEGVAIRGIDVYQVQSMILPTGGSAGTVAVSGYHE